MLGNEAQACSTVQALNTASLSAGANNGTWLAVSDYEGDLLFVISQGATTGNVVVKVTDATDGSGTGAADVTGATTAALSTANTSNKLVVKSSAVRSHVRVIATVTTGPVVVGVTLVARPKTTA
jgi:hypothetical protein